MGSSSSKKNVESKQNLKNYVDDFAVQKEAEQKRIDPALVAYQRQKTDTQKGADMLRQRTDEQKQADLMNREMALQERIDEANEQMLKAKNVREALVKITPVAEPVVKKLEDRTQVSRQPTQSAAPFAAAALYKK